MPVTVLAQCKSGVCAQRMIDLPPTDEDAVVPQLSASVGEKGANRFADVQTVQSLLNGVEPNEGGPTTALTVDGICGPLTKAAILKFQRRHRDLLSDGLVERNRNTWKKLLALAGAGPVTARPADLTAGAKTGAGAAPAPSPVTDEIQKLFTTYLFLSRHRIHESIKCLDKASQELDLLNIRTFMRPAVSLAQAYIESVNDPLKYKNVEELTTANRCFRLLEKKKDSLDMKMTAAQVAERLKRIRAVYVTMLEVIAMTSVTTAADELTGRRRFLRVVRQGVLAAAHPERGFNGVIADAVLGGWHHKDARIARMRYGSAHIDDPSAFSTCIHELAHFVSSHQTFWIGDHGYYHKAFDASPYLALRNAESYSWFALLSSFKHLRSLPDKSLPTDI